MKHLQLLITYLFLNATTISAQTERITFEAPQVYPEGTCYYNNTFFVSSARTGTIGKVDTKGAYTVFYADPSLKSSFGMKVDSANHTLWVCTGDPNYSIYSEPATFKKMIHLIGLDIETGQKKKDIDLSNLFPGKHFANDLTLDNVGNIYITDSYSPVIYKVTPNGNASVFVQNNMFKAIDIGLNGIVWHSGGFLLTVNNSTGAVLKISTNDSSNVTKVMMNDFFPGADGLLLDEQGNLILVQNKGVNRAFMISSKDNWKSAIVKSATATNDLFQNPSTCTSNQGKIYLLNSKLNELQDPSMTPSKEFSLQAAVFR